MATSGTGRDAGLRPLPGHLPIAYHPRPMNLVSGTRLDRHGVTSFLGILDLHVLEGLT